MASDEYIGARVRIETDDGRYEGNINQVDLNSRKLTLERVLVVDSGKRLQGVQHFYGNELESLEFLEDSPTLRPSREVENKRERGQSVLDKGHKYTPPHLRNLRSRDEVRDRFDAPVAPSYDEQVDTARPNSPGTTKSGYDSGIDQEGSLKCKSTFAYTVLDKLGDELYQEALDHIVCHNIISLALEGIDLAREGKLCWLQIATAGHVFLFDVKTLGSECFPQGLKDILESQRILKVMHNSRLPSDMLWHQFKVKLVNIFDTQVADVFVYRNRHAGDWPRYVMALPLILIDYLNLAPTDVYIKRVRKGCPQEDEAFWAERPAPAHVLDAAIKEVVYLRELRMVLMEKMLTEFTAGVDIFLNHVREASSSDARNLKEAQHLLPTVFTDFSLRVNYGAPRSRRHKEIMKDYAKKDPNGFRENCKLLPDPAALKPSQSSIQAQARSDQTSVTPDVLGKRQIPTKNFGAASGEATLEIAQKGPVREGSPTGVDREGVKPAAGRGSIRDSGSLEVTPGAAATPTRHSGGENPSETGHVSDAEEPSRGPCWDTLLNPETTDLKGIILKPAGAQEKPKKARDKPDDQWPDGNRIFQTLSQSYSPDTIQQAEEDTSRDAASAVGSDLDLDCFDAIPPRRSQAKSAASIDPKRFPFTDFGSFTFDETLPEGRAPWSDSHPTQHPLITSTCTETLSVQDTFSSQQSLTNQPASSGLESHVSNGAEMSSADQRTISDTVNNDRLNCFTPSTSGASASVIHGPGNQANVNLTNSDAAVNDAPRTSSSLQKLGFLLKIIKARDQSKAGL